MIQRCQSLFVANNDEMSEFIITVSIAGFDKPTDVISFVIEEDWVTICH